MDRVTRIKTTTPNSHPLTADILRRHLPPPGPETVLFLCGPLPMRNALEEIIRGLGYPEESVIFL